MLPKSSMFIIPGGEVFFTFRENTLLMGMLRVVEVSALFGRTGM